ncbi:hypothetical protein BDN71DRAFT_1435844 [Pleurotus eryngii]|uniref:Uncharacterized protein n=1 Tax=Pleurotus eryngii TaxID=5323 RepID=A0A9P5ZK88_PLEER|nr:hypothetical protein BDN71DRAFT_1435844 [Pleurotus eryngii]
MMESVVLRSEFAKSWAHVRHWTEEVTLLREEMRCVMADLLYLLADSFEANWTTNASISEDADDIDKEDLQAEIDSATVEAEEDGEDEGLQWSRVGQTRKCSGMGAPR